MCPEDQYMASASVRFVDYLGPGRTLGDDTGVEGIRFKCKSHDGEDEEIIQYEGDKGEWKNWSRYTTGKFISQARARTDLSGGTDWAGMTGLSLWMCPADQGEGEEVDDCISEGGTGHTEGEDGAE